MIMQQCDVKLRETEHMVILYTQHASHEIQLMNGNFVGK